MKTTFFRYKLHHLLLWMVLFGVWYYLRYEDYTLRSTALWITLVKVVDLAILVYVTNYLLIPRLLYRKKYVWFVLALVVMIVSSSLIKMKIIAWIFHNPNAFDLAGNLKTRIYDNVIPHFFLVIAGGAFKLLYDYNRTQRRLNELAREKAEAELNFLKSQINPHFLFNSLNTVYFLIDRNNHEARQALHQFSEMLRYQLYEAGGERIPIEKEIAYLRDYVYLQKLRKDENYQVQFDCAPEVKDFTIEPLLLVPFVENAFKHISHYPNGENFVHIGLSKENGSFRMLIENSKEKHRQPSTGEGGIGLQNVQRRLELLYPARHTLSIDDAPDRYAVTLELKTEM